MNLHDITPLVLTWNEEPNIATMVNQLRWAPRVVVVDSGSTDRTVEICRSASNVEVFNRPFDTASGQWNFGLTGTGIDSEWVLALDADYRLGDGSLRELSELNPPAEVNAYAASFRYAVLGRPLRASLYPPVAVLFRRNAGTYVQDGHTQRLKVSGSTAELKAPFLHDDRKPLDRWLLNQVRYMRAEAEKLEHATVLSWPDRIRRTRVLGPPATLLYTLFAKGVILDGVPGLYYAFQRATAEAILSLELLERDLRKTTR